MQHLEPDQRNYKNFKKDITEYSIVVFHCKKCKIDIDEKDVKKHALMHTQEVCKICDTCGKVFNILGSWYRHQKIHQVKKSGNSWVCKVCGKSCIFRAALRDHMKTHSNERPHICEVCGKCFKDSSGLKKHGTVHSTVMTISCEYCGKGFNRHDNYKTHLRSHTGGKPYQCDICEAAFTYNTSLKSHKISVHGTDSWKGRKSQIIDDINLEDPELYNLRKLQETSGGKEKPEEASSK